MNQTAINKATFLSLFVIVPEAFGIRNPSGFSERFPTSGNDIDVALLMAVSNICKLHFNF
jgi:hypothetical protein